MLELLQRITAWIMNGVRVNGIECCVHDGIPMVVKRRRMGGSIAIFFGNRLWPLARSGSRMFVWAKEWTMMERRILEIREILERVAKSCDKSPGELARNHVPGIERRLRNSVSESFLV